MEEHKNTIPTYREIPSVGLYLNQAEKYLSECLNEFPGVSITGSMISNYVKQRLISSPVKKQYDRDQIAELFFIAIAKTVLSMDNIKRLLIMQRDTDTIENNYEHFRNELAEAMNAVHAGREPSSAKEKNVTRERHILRNVVIAVAHKLYLDEYLADLAGELPDEVEEKTQEKKKSVLKAIKNPIKLSPTDKAQTNE